MLQGDTVVVTLREQLSLPLTAFASPDDARDPRLAEMMVAAYEVLRLREDGSYQMQHFFRDFAEHVCGLYTGNVRFSEGALQLIQQNRLLEEQTKAQQEANRIERERLDLERRRVEAAETSRASSERSRLDAESAAERARQVAESATRRDALLAETEREIFCDRVYRAVSAIDRRRFNDVVAAFVNNGGGLRGNVRNLGRFGEDAQGRLVADLMLDPSRTCAPFDRRAYEAKSLRLLPEDQRDADVRVTEWLRSARVRPIPSTLSEALRTYMPDVYITLSKYMHAFRELCDNRPNVTLEEILTNDDVYLPFVVWVMALQRREKMPLAGTKRQIEEMHSVLSGDDGDLRRVLYEQGWRSTPKRRL